MFIKDFKATYGLALPLLSILCCLILAGCGDDTQMVDPNDQVVLDPSEIGISPGGKPVPVTATWQSSKSGATFEKWTAGSDPDTYTLRIDAGKEKQSPTTINVECSPTLLERVNMHTFTGGYTSQATISAQLQRNGMSKTVKNLLKINVLVPYLKYDVTSSTRKKIDPQTVEATATILVSILNAQSQTSYNFSIDSIWSYMNTCNTAKVCESNYVSSTATTILAKPTAPGTTGTFVLKQTFKAVAPNTIGQAKWDLWINADPVGGGQSLRKNGQILF